MPHIWNNNKVVVTKEELIPDFFPSWEALRKKLYRDSRKKYGMRRARMGKGLGNEVLIDYDTLPPEIKKELRDPRKVDCILERYFWEDSKAVHYFANARPGKLGGIEFARQKEYVLDASVIMAALRLKAAHITSCSALGMTVKNVDKYISESVNMFNKFRALKNLPEHTLPTNPVSLKRKINRFEQEGYSSLLIGYRNNNASKKSALVNGLLNAMYIQADKPTPTEVFRQYDAFLAGYVQVINTDTGEEYNPKDFGKLSERTVTSFLSSWKERIATHSKRSANRQKYMTTFEPHQTFQHTEYAGSIISVDDRQPPFEYEKTKRVWFYNGIDLGSECIMAFVWGKAKEGLILDFYREIARNCEEWGVSVPFEVECESSLNASFRETLLREGNMFQAVNIIPNKAQSKRVERYFGNLRYDYEKKRSGWIGRPHARNEAYQTDPTKKVIIPYDTLVNNCLQDITDWNNSPHSIHTDKTRWEVFMEKQHPDIPPTNWRGILPFIGEKTRTSCRRGNIQLNNGLCVLGDNGEIFTGDRLIGLMDILEGQEFDVYWLRGHSGQVLKALIYMDERCICEAIPKPKAIRSKLEARGNKQAEKNYELMERYRMTVVGYAQRHKNEIEKVVVIDNRRKTLNNGFRIPHFQVEEYNYESAEEAVVLPDIEDDELFCEGVSDNDGYGLKTLGERF